jgi:hypothetical protein
MDKALEKYKTICQGNDFMTVLPMSVQSEAVTAAGILILKVLAIID